MEFTAKQIAGFIQGEIEGDENAKINSFAKIEEGKEGAISFLSNPKYTHFIYDTKSSVVLINRDRTLEAGVTVNSCTPIPTLYIPEFCCNSLLMYSMVSLQCSTILFHADLICF